MTGAYLRVKRNGKWQNSEVEYLTDAEREEILKDDPRLMKWMHLACKKLVEADKLFKELEEDGILTRAET